MRTAAALGHLRERVAFWALAGVALLGSHDAIFLIQVGPGEQLTRALRSAGHQYWGAASLALLMIGVVAAVIAATRLLTLHRRARGLAGPRPSQGAPFGRRLLITWGRLFAIVAIGFVIQESLEHLAMHGHAIGAGALIGPEYPLALPVIGLITLVSAMAATLVRRTEATLLEAIAAGISRVVTRAPRRADRPPLRMPVPRISILASAAAGRAPPRMLVSAT